MKNPRTIVVKTLFNPDEFLNFESACVTADVPQSKQLRDLAKDWMAQRKNKAKPGGREWPGGGQNMAMLLPGRVNYGGAHMRMRV